MSASQSFKDHFSQLARQYAEFRPRYPAALFEYLARTAPARGSVWDCACGSGQATVDLAAHFESVIATDASAQQIASAPAHPRVVYRVSKAESSGLASDSIDLIAVAQSLHWFDLEAFYAEVRRVLHARGVLAVWTYGVLRLDSPAADELMQAFYHGVVGPYWPPERKLVEDGYRSVPFPFDEMPAPSFSMEQPWSLPQLLGYVRSWSATGRYVQQHDADPVMELQKKMKPLWGDPEHTRVITWPLAMRIGRK